MKRIAALLMAVALTACAAEKPRDIWADWEARRAARLAELEPLHGRCKLDGWKSVSVIGKTTATELIAQIKACDVWSEADTSRYVSAGRETVFVQIGTDYLWQFQNGVLVSMKR